MAGNNKSFYIERTDFSLRLARVSRGNDGDVIEEISEVSSNSPEEQRALIQKSSPTSGGGMLRAYCSIYPRSRILRNCSLKDPSRPGEISTLEDVVTNQFRVNPGEYALHALHADDGLRFEEGKAQRELLVCGAPYSQLEEAQRELVDAGVYPLRMELGSVAAIGLLLNGMQTQKIEGPALVLEVGEETSHVLILNSNRIESARPLPLGLNSMIAGVRQELGLKDEGAARKLFYSDSFDFREMGPRLIDRLLREVQSMIGFYEVQTGQSVTRMLCSLLPGKLSWLTGTFASSLGMSPLALSLPELLAHSNITVAETNPPISLDGSLGLLGLMINREVEK